MAKSWSVAQHLLIAGAKQTLRTPCASETMKSIKGSVHQLLEDQITLLGLQAYYELQKAEIIGRRINTAGATAPEISKIMSLAKLRASK